MDVSLFDYELPSELIAQEPPSRVTPPDSSWWTAPGGRGGPAFGDLPSFCARAIASSRTKAGCTRAAPRRARAGRTPVEILMLGPAADGALGGAGAAGPPVPRGRAGERRRPGRRAWRRRGEGRRRARGDGRSARGRCRAARRHGLPPLPPYIARHGAPKPDDRERYQTVYARHARLGGRAHRPGCTSRPSCSTRCGARDRGRAPSRCTSASARSGPSGADASRSTACTPSASISRRDGRRRSTRPRARGPARRRRRHHRRRARSSRRGDADGWRRSRPRQTRSLHPPPGTLPRGRRAAHELPPAALDAAGAGRGVRRARARCWRAYAHARAEPATASTPTATRC